MSDIQTHHGSSFVASRTLASISLMFNTTFFAFIMGSAFIHALHSSHKAHLIVVAFYVVKGDLRKLTRKCIQAIHYGQRYTLSEDDRWRLWSVQRQFQPQSKQNQSTTSDNLPTTCTPWKSVFCHYIYNQPIQPNSHIGHQPSFGPPLKSRSPHITTGARQRASRTDQDSASDKERGR